MVARRIAAGPRRAARRAARPGPRLPDARAQHADAVARRAAAAAAATQVRSNLFGVVYVLDEPSAAAPGRHRGAAARARPAEGRRQLAVRRRARARRDPPRRLDRRRRPGGRRARRPRALQRPARRAARRRGVAAPARYLFAERRAAAARRRGTPQRLAAARAASRATTCTTSTSPSRSACSRRVTGVSGSGKSSLVSQALVELVAAHLGHEVAAAEDEAAELERGAGRRRPAAASSAGMEAHQAAGARRPEADRPHAALEPRDLHRPVRPRPQAVRRDARRRGRAATTPGASRSTSPRAAARPARARAS